MDLKKHLNKINRNPTIMKATEKGCILSFFVFLFLVVVLVVPSVIEKAKYYDMRKNKGERMVQAEKAYYDKNYLYTSNIEELLSIDNNLSDYSEVKIIFLSANSSGFTFFTEHSGLSNRRLFTQGKRH